MTWWRGFALLWIALSAVYAESQPATPSVWPAEVQKIQFDSSADKSLQPALFFPANTSTPAPLLVGLHTWSGDYRQTLSVPYAQWCLEHKWNFIHPNFRGPNNNPFACGSELVVADIVSAVSYARAHANVDETRIYCVGVSGGGMAALLMAGRAPEIWAGVSAWAPIADLKQWYVERSAPGDKNRKLWEDMHAALGGDPATDSAAAEQARLRSPITYLERARGIPIDINEGIHDGYTGSVPIGHALNAFNVLANDAQRIAEADIHFMVRKQMVPEALAYSSADEQYGEKKVLFRRQSGNARITIFEGGHEIIYNAALSWLSLQRKSAGK
jgi:pimeloyl-ACP methyl ester carboxylesterase